MFSSARILVASIVCLFIAIGYAEAGSKRGRHSACANGSCSTASTTQAKPQANNLAGKPDAVKQEASACANGSCSTSSAKSSRRHR